MQKSLKKYIEIGLKYNGQNWYKNANKSLMDFCRIKGIKDIDRFIDIIAITSPRVAVKRNMKLAVEYYFTGKVSGVLPSTLLALKNYEKTGRINGQKTSQFSRALKMQNDAIVLDVWMAVALNIDQNKFSLKSVQVKANKKIKYYSKKYNLSFSEIQAAVWCGVLKDKGRNIPPMNFDLLNYRQLSLEF